jgi:integrase
MLSASAVRDAKPQAAARKLRDERGLYLLVQPNGARWWRFDYRRPGTGKRNTLSLGIYPDVSLKKARDRRDDARKLLAESIDPADKRKAEAVAAADTFEAVAREWYATRARSWVPAHGERIMRRLERDVFPWIGRKPMASVQAPDVLAILRRIQARGAIETAHRALTNIGQVIRYGIATGRTQADVTHKLGESLTPVTKRHHAAITDPDQLGHLLRDIDAYNGTLPVRCALQLAPLVFLRPGELRQAEWEEFDLDAGEWNVPAHRRKLKKALKDDPLTGAHLVPLASQAVAILRELQPLTGAGRFVFPGTRDRKKPLSDMALLAALRRMGYDKATVTTHGWRATARTILDEGLGFPMHVIEHQLDHAVKDANGRAYNRTSHLPQRRQMMQAWADYLDALRAAPGKVVAIGKARAAQT